MYYAKLFLWRTGMTNQMFGFITSILITLLHTKHKVIIFDNFSNDFISEEVTPLSKIINIDKMNIFLKNKYGVIIACKNEVFFKLESVFYGTDENKIDITEEINKNFSKDGAIIIKKETNLNKIKGDPCIMTQKKLYISYTINSNKVVEIYDESNEYPCEDICINCLDSNFNYNFGWTYNYSQEIFDDILVNIEFQKEYLEYASKIFDCIDINKKINVLHLRLEEDAIKHWAVQNKLSEDDFKNKLEEKYITAIKCHINKDDETILLSGSLSNGVTEFLKNNNYNFMFSEKFFSGREQNAIVDLLIAKNCNGVFLGNYNMRKCTGSTFSYYIDKILIDGVKKMYIDLDRINEDLVVYSNNMQIFYGIIDKKIDVTQICLEQLNKNNIITIPEDDIARCNIFTDPLYGVLKKIFILKDNILTEYNHKREVIINLTSEEITTTFSDKVVQKLSEIQSKLQIKHGNFEAEYNEQILSVKYLTGNEKILELGGNIGRNSLIIAHILSQKNNNNFVTLESDEFIANQLIENRDINGFKFHVEPCALSKRKLIQKGWQTIESDVLLEGCKNVNIISFDELKKKYNIAFDTLVLDCEGAFYYILMDMPEILDNINLIIVENDYFDMEKNYFEESKKNYVDEILKKNKFYVEYFEDGGWLFCQNNFYEVWKRALD